MTQAEVAGNWQRPSGSLMLAADQAGIDKTFSVLLEGGPPEP